MYLTPDGTTPIANASVVIQDATGATFGVRTNCVGNFFATPKVFKPVYPFRVWVAYEDTQVDMESKVHRDGSCASCHKKTPGPTSAGPIFLTDLPNPPEVPSCQ